MSNPEKRKRDHVKDFFGSLSPFSSTSKPSTSKDEKPESKEPGPSEPSKDQDSSQDNGGCQYKPRGRPRPDVVGPQGDKSKDKQKEPKKNDKPKEKREEPKKKDKQKDSREGTK